MGGSAVDAAYRGIGQQAVAWGSGQCVVCLFLLGVMILEEVVSNIVAGRSRGKEGGNEADSLTCLIDDPSAACSERELVYLDQRRGCPVRTARLRGHGHCKQDWDPTFFRSPRAVCTGGLDP